MHCMRQVFLFPEGYCLKSVLISHGWSGLAPFQVAQDYQSVKFGFLGHGKPTHIQIKQDQNQFIVHAGRNLSKVEIGTIEWMFGINSNLKKFYQMAKQHGRPWIQKNKMGRLMRSETVFEDLIKLILTTNCTWGLTKKMVSDLCMRLGEKFENFHCFPKPEMIAKKNEEFFKTKVKVGYRAPYLIQISKMVASGNLDIEAWKTDHHSYEELKKEILSLPGAGPYVAENLLRLLGKFDGLGVDSWVRGQLQKRWNSKKQPDSKTILKKYKQFEEYKGLILWCDVTRSWYEGQRKL